MSAIFNVNQKSKPKLKTNDVTIPKLVPGQFRGYSLQMRQYLRLRGLEKFINKDLLSNYEQMNISKGENWKPRNEPSRTKKLKLPLPLFLFSREAAKHSFLVFLILLCPMLHLYHPFLPHSIL